VRGAYTLAQLERLGHGKRGAVVGCPSNFIHSDPALGQAIASKYLSGPLDRLAVPAGLHYWPNTQRIEQCLADLVEQCSGLYVAQSEIEMVQLARDEAHEIAPDALELMRAHIRPTLDTADFLRWIRRYAVTFVDAASWLDAMRKFDFVVGARFHGVMLGIQAGVPGGVIAHDSRTLELCQTIGIPVRDYTEVPDHFTINDLKAMFPFDGATYDRRRAKLARALADMLACAGIALTSRNLSAIATLPATAAAA
jgi:polysaccharide pyruvyl transferase WcaK-like protein